MTKSAPQPPLPSIRWEEAEDVAAQLKPVIAHFWDLFQSGDNSALFDLVIWCLASGQVPPATATTEFIARYDLWRGGKVRSLDTAFQVERREGKHVGGFPSRERLRPHIAVRVWELHQGEGMPIDRRLFQTVARELGISRSVVERVYYDPKSSTWHKLAATGLFKL